MRQPINLVTFTPDRDTPDRKTGRMQRDYSVVFSREARRFVELHAPSGAKDRRHEVSLDLGKPNRLAVVTSTLLAYNATSSDPPIDCVALFCHGSHRSCQLGLTADNAATFARAVAPVLARDVTFVLYACSTADGEGNQRSGPGGDGGLADRLRDALCVAGLVDCVVYGHTVAGHATGNPYVRRFDGAGSPSGGQGGHFVIDPTDAERWPLWRRYVDDDGPRKGEMGRLRFPFLTAVELDVAIRAA